MNDKGNPHDRNGNRIDYAGKRHFMLHGYDFSLVASFPSSKFSRRRNDFLTIMRGSRDWDNFKDSMDSTAANLKLPLLEWGKEEAREQKHSVSP